MTARTSLWPILLSVCLFTGCTEISGPGSPPPGGGGPAKLVPFQSSAELVDLVRNEFNRARSGRGAGVLLFPALAGAPTDAAVAETGGGDFSTTNLQVAGVDESDVFKSDGANFFIADGAALRVVQATPFGELALLGSLELPQPIEALYLAGNTLIAIAQQFAFAAEPAFFGDVALPYVTLEAKTTVFQLDISNPAAPLLVRSAELDGSLLTSRRIEDRLLLVLAAMPRLSDARDATLETILPEISVDGQQREAIPWESWLHPIDPDGYAATAVVTLNVGDVSQVIDSLAVMANTGVVYASTEALYLCDTDYALGSGLRVETTIHKISLQDRAARYVASGRVPGRPLNQFSLGEHESVLRIATHIEAQFFGALGGGDADGAVGSAGVSTATNATAQSMDERPSVASNAVYTLGEAGDALSILGRIEGIAPTERIYSALFTGPRGFLVTFRQIDPLFTLDLSDPAAPAIAGELKIPGFSDYLHPVGEDRLIGVGRSVAETPFGGVAPSKLQLSLFDVADFSNPVLIQQIELGGRGSSSDVSQTHKAFTFLPERGLLLLPAWLTEATGPGDFLAETTRSVLVLSVDAQGFTPLGQIVANSANDLFIAWLRGAVIGDLAFAVSDASVVATPLSDLSVTQTLPLP